MYVRHVYLCSVLFWRDPPATLFFSISSRLEPVCGDASGEIFVFANGSLSTLSVDWHPGLRAYHVSLELLPSILCLLQSSFEDGTRLFIAWRQNMASSQHTMTPFWYQCCCLLIICRHSRHSWQSNNTSTETMRMYHHKKPRKQETKHIWIHLQWPFFLIHMFPTQIARILRIGGMAETFSFVSPLAGQPASPDSKLGSF